MASTTTDGYSQIKEPDSVATQRISYLKFSAFPFLFAGIFRNDFLWVILHYEAQLKLKSRLTYNIVLDYRSNPTTVSLNGVVVSKTINYNFYVRPQLRYYTGKETFKGYYAGVFPLYLYRNEPSSDFDGSFWGGGITTGYQTFIRKKYPLEFNAYAAWQTGIVSQYDSYAQQPVQQRYSYVLIFFELNLGLPIYKRR